MTSYNLKNSDHIQNCRVINTNPFRDSFFPSTIRAWNILPMLQNDIMQATSVASFKYRLNGSRKGNSIFTSAIILVHRQVKIWITSIYHVPNGLKSLEKLISCKKQKRVFSQHSLPFSFVTNLKILHTILCIFRLYMYINLQFYFSTAIVDNVWHLQTCLQSPWAVRALGNQSGFSVVLTVHTLYY